MFLLTLSSLLAFSQAQQIGSDWCQEWQNEIGRDAGIMCACIAGLKLDQKTKDAYQQCSYQAEAGSAMPAGRSIFGSAPTKRGVEERQTSDGQCPPVSEMGIAVNDPNPMYPDDSMKDCVLGAMDFLAPAGYPRNKKIRKALNSIIVPNVLDFFSYGNSTKEKWNNCYEMFGYRNYMMKRADECGDAYTEEEAKAMKFYGARWDAYNCLTVHLRNACEEGLWEMEMGK